MCSCASLLRNACPPGTTICVIADNTVGDFSVDVCSARHVQVGRTLPFACTLNRKPVYFYRVL